MSTHSTSEQMVRDFLHAVNEREYSALSESISDSLTWIDPSLPKGEVQGSDAFETMLREIVVRFPDFHIEILDILANEKVAMVELLYTGAHEGEFFGLPPTGRAIEFQGVETYQIESGTLERGRVYFSDAELKEQLGLTFPEVIGQLPKLAVGKLRAVIWCVGRSIQCHNGTNADVTLGGLCDLQDMRCEFSRATTNYWTAVINGLLTIEYEFSNRSQEPSWSQTNKVPSRPLSA